MYCVRYGGDDDDDDDGDNDGGEIRELGIINFRYGGFVNYV